MSLNYYELISWRYTRIHKHTLKSVSFFIISSVYGRFIAHHYDNIGDKLQTRLQDLQVL